MQHLDHSFDSENDFVEHNLFRKIEIDTYKAREEKSVSTKKNYFTYVYTSFPDVLE